MVDISSCLIFLTVLLRELEKKDSSEFNNGNVPNGSTPKPGKDKCDSKDGKNKENIKDDEKSKELDYTPEQLAEVKR